MVLPSQLFSLERKPEWHLQRKVSTIFSHCICSPHTSNNSFGTQGESTSGFGNAFIAGTENDKNKTTLSYIAGGDDQKRLNRKLNVTDSSLLIENKMS